MKREPKALDIRKTALKVLVPLVHLEASAWVPHDAALASELRRIADRMDDLGTRGTPSVLAAFWGAMG